MTQAEVLTPCLVRSPVAEISKFQLRELLGLGAPNKKCLYKRNVLAKLIFVTTTRPSLYKAKSLACSLANGDKPIVGSYKEDLLVDLFLFMEMRKADQLCLAVETLPDENADPDNTDACLDGGEPPSRRGHIM